jgi:hypothetical protein
MTLAQQNGITQFPYIITDEKGNRIYFEDSDGSWRKREYDTRGNRIYFEDSYGYWWKSEYDVHGNEIYFEDSAGYWIKRECDEQGNEIYFEDSKGLREDNRPKKLNHSKVKLTI